MVRRRAAFNPLEQTTAQHWYVVRSMHGTIIESRELSAGSDLKRVFVTSILEWMTAGWSIGEFSSATATFFCTRARDRRMVSIDPIDPHNTPVYGASHLAKGCPTCDE
jgi:hypothetical protein